MKVEFSRQIFGKARMSNFMNIRPVGAGQSDIHDEAQNRCWQSQFGNAPKLPEQLSVAVLIV
jgi:hypothetical protein